jgi:DNA-binding SARP family transcriptional activator
MSQPGTLTIAVLGPFRATCNGRLLPLAPGSRAQALLTFLLLHHDRPVERSYLAGQLEPDLTDAIARRRLSDAIYQLRQALPEGRLHARPKSLVLRLAPQDICDLRELEDVLREPVGAATAQRLLACPDPLIGLELEHEWIMPLREGLRLRFLTALEQSAQAAAEQGAWTTVRDLLQRVLQLEPLRETAQQNLLHAYAMLGSLGEATAQYTAWRERLQREYSFSPDQVTERIAERLTRQSARPLEPASIALPAELPLVGRDRERRRMLTWLDQADHQATLALLEGHAGIGKSHLLAHVADDARWRGWQVARATAGNEGSVIEHALAPLFTPLQYEQIAATLPGVWRMRLEYLFSGRHSPSLLGSAYGGSEPKWYREAILLALESLTQHAPLLLILDDIHQAADPDLALLPQIAGLITRHPLVLIVSYRPSVRDDLDRWPQVQLLGDLAADCRLQLTVLPADACATLLQRTIGLCSELTVEYLEQVSGGHPLMLCEAIQVLIERNAWHQGYDGRWRVEPHALEVVQLPTVDQTIATRLRHLAAPDRLLLHCIAVHKAPLSVAQLVLATDHSAQWIIDRAQHLVQRHLLRVHPSGYTCAHDLVAQAVYAQMNAEEQRTIHGRLFTALAEGTDGSREQLAQHAFAAEAWAAAVPFLLAAAHERRQRADYRAALRLITQAETALEQSDLPHVQRQCYIIDLLFERLQIWSWHPPEQLKQYRVDLEQLDAALADDSPLRPRLLIAWVNYELAQGNNQAALDLATAAITEYAGAEPGVVARLHMQAGKAAQFVGAVAVSQAYLRQAYRLGCAADDGESTVAALGLLAIYDHFAGDFTAARRGYQQVRDRAESHGLLIAGLIASANLAALDHAEGNLAAALSGYEYVVTRMERYAAVDPADLESLAEVTMHIGDFPRAAQLLDQAIALWERRSGNPALAVCRRITLALARDAVDEAQHYLAATHALPQIQDDARVQGEVHVWQAMIFLETGQLALIEAEVQQAEHIYRRMGVRFYDAFLHAVCAIGLARQGKLEHAQQAVQQAEAALAKRIQTFVDPRYLLGLTAEVLNDPSAATFYLDAWNHVTAQSAALPPEYARCMQATPYYQRLEWAVRRTTTEEVPVRLPLKYAPTGRPLHPWETVSVVWEHPTPPSADSDRHQRWHVLRTLILQANLQDAAPSLSALAKALQVSVATVSRDVQALRAAGERLLTRG